MILQSAPGSVASKCQAAEITAHAAVTFRAGEQINTGLAGFNAVLAAVAIHAFCGSDIRLDLLGTTFASAILPMFTELNLISLAARFLVTTWLIMLLGWFPENYVNEKPAIVNSSP